MIRLIISAALAASNVRIHSAIETNNASLPGQSEAILLTDTQPQRCDFAFALHSHDSTE
jgi:hypothetical protein